MFICGFIRLFHTRDTFHRAGQLAQLSRRAYAGFMAQPDCPLCGGTGWKTVDRVAEEEKLTRGSWEKPIEGTNATKRVWAVPCDCTGKDRTARAMGRARIPNRYEHCDFDNFDTKLYDLKTALNTSGGTMASSRPSWSPKRLPAIIPPALTRDSC